MKKTDDFKGIDNIKTALVAIAVVTLIVGFLSGLLMAVVYIKTKDNVTGSGVLGVLNDDSGDTANRVYELAAEFRGIVSERAGVTVIPDGAELDGYMDGYTARYLVSGDGEIERFLVLVDEHLNIERVGFLVNKAGARVEMTWTPEDFKTFYNLKH